MYYRSTIMYHKMPCVITIISYVDLGRGSSVVGVTKNLGLGRERFRFKGGGGLGLEDLIVRTGHRGFWIQVSMWPCSIV